MEENQGQQAAADTGAQDDDWSGVEASFLEDKGVERKQEEGAANGKGDDAGKPAAQGADGAAAGGSADDKGKKADTAGESADGAAASDKKDDSDGADGEGDPNSDRGSDDDTSAIRNQRTIQREIEADRRQMRDDIREKMFADSPTELTDADGDPIRTPADVMKLRNPNTGKNFTTEEATAWLFQAQKHLESTQKEVSEKIERIADVNIMIKDDTGAIRAEFGEILDKMPELRKEIWADYKQTLVLDEKTGLIVGAPMPLYRFFRLALKPYAAQAAQMQQQADNGQAAQDAARVQAEAAEKAKVEAAQKAKQIQSDRQDITSSGNTNTAVDPEEKEWADEAKKYYEG